ncbi:recombinase family protein, partial [Algiphilus sp.]|uniref:recombinase family protein n=1 Tax=Algiphilus sp. TaxID=1872431 RepID=UPI0025C3EA1E
MRIAAYARYSSDQQRESSIEDQLRNVAAHCERMGWAEPMVYTDSAISGARKDRPGYTQLLADAGRFDVLVVDDLSRLSRDSAELTMAMRRLRFGGVRVVGVSDGVDTERKSHKAEVGLRGLMGEMYLDDLAEKTHRGLSGRALAGASAGGLPYGYTVTSTGERAIHPEQAQVVRRIFADYLAGNSPRAIAAALNAEGVPTGRRGKWSNTTIYGDRRRGIGILVNPMYAGRLVWNRSQWIKHPETGRRVRRERPESEWIIHERPELAIIDRETWDAVQARMRGAGRATQAKGNGGKGRPNKHLLSGLMRCGNCGGPMVIIDRYRYGCTHAKERGTCAAPVRVAKRAVEDAVLQGVREDLLTEERFQQFADAARQAIGQQAPDLTALERAMHDAERERDNIMTAIRQGIITSTTRSEMLAAEDRVEQAKQTLAEAQAYQPAQLLPRAREVWRRLTAELSDVSRDEHAAREALQELLGEITLRDENGELHAELGAQAGQINVVAGAGFE